MTLRPDGVLIVVLLALAVCLVLFCARMLMLHPAPAFGRLSLRRRALRVLRPRSRRERLRLRARHTSRHLQSLRWLAYVGIVATLWLPLSLDWGPLASEPESRRYLETMWQVVAAALGVSVAMVAFAFEAFSSSGQRTHGGTLREFAFSSRLVYAIEVGLLSLIVDGVVLFGPLGLETESWPAAFAIAMSGLTLVFVGLVIHLVLRLLDERALTRMRRRRLDVLLEGAMRQQLIGQAAQAWLSGSGLPVAYRLVSSSGAIPTRTQREGEIRDVHLGWLARWAVRKNRTNPKESIALAVMLGDPVSRNDALFFTGSSIGRFQRLILMRAIRIRRRDDDRPDRALSALLTTLHQQSMEAARTGREDQWRTIAEAYERILLGLPQAAADWGIPFEGAVAAPGFFGHGPVQRIADYLYEELVAAVDNNHRELIDPITYLPQHIAVEATRLGAPSVASPMLRLYPAMYGLVQKGR